MLKYIKKQAEQDRRDDGSQPDLQLSENHATLGGATARWQTVTALSGQIKPSASRWYLTRIDENELLIYEHWFSRFYEHD